LVLREISKFDATRCQILKLKCAKFDFRCGSAGEAYSALPHPLAVFKEPTSRGREGKRGTEREREVKRREETKGEGRTPKYFGLEPPLGTARF